MADNLTYQIGFDLEEAVKKAGQEWISTYADKLEKLLAKRAITVNLRFSTKHLNNLDDVKRRLAELKIEPLTPENKTAIKDLLRELKELAKVMEKVQKYSNIQTPELQQALANKANAEATHMAEKYRQANERVEIAKRRVALAEQKYAESVFQSSKATQTQTRTYQEQTTYLNRLLKRMATYWSIRQVQTFITSVREVTAQFELQRVSLGAIIQDQARANQLFSEIKAFALKSPASIMDLTKYTKQLAAYKIETDELFETTKKLTDISVGLSVSLDRVILAYGQVRARGALYSSEIRQFTEMGVPIVEELAAKLTKMNGQLVTSAQVLKMVEKGAISFGLVKEVFDDMTSAGGVFYNMQERQGNTLFGMWQKLGDAASVMYDEIGNTSIVNGQMKETIAILTDLMKNWRYVANAMMMAVPTMLLVHNIEKTRAATSARQIAAMNTLTAATTKRMVAEKALNQAIASGLTNTAAKARMNLILAQTEEKVAQKALTAGNSIGLLGKRFNVFGGALKSLSTFVATNFWTILLTGIALLTSALVSANEKANRLKNTLAEIGSSGSLELSQTVQNFEHLAKIAVESTDGSKKQRDALDELHRTYKEMIPVQDMTIEKLRAMNGDYRKLTIAIEEYIRARMKQQQIDAVTSEIGADLAKYERKMTEDAQGFYYTYDRGATKHKLTYDQIQLLIKGIKEIAKTERALPTRKVFAKALTDYVGLDAENLEVGLDEWLNTFDDGLFGIVRSVRRFEGEIDRIKANETLDTTLGKYAESWKKVNERIENLTVKGAKAGSFAFDRATTNASVKQYVSYLKEVLGDAWDESFASIEKNVGANGENMSAIYWEAVMKNWDTYTVAQQNAILKVQKAYDGLLPSDRTVVILREKLQQISGQFGVNMDITKQYLMNAGEDIETYAKRVKSSLEEAQNNLKELRFNKSQIESGVGVGVLNPVSDEEIEKADNLTKVLAALFELISGFTKTSGSGRQSDPRLQTLQEIANKMAEVNREYDELLKKEGQTKALADTQKLFASSFKQMEATANKYGFELPAFEVPQTIEDVQKWYKAISDEIKRLNLKNADKVLIELGFKSDKAAIDKQQKDIESRLKELADRISRTKTAKEFYEKILSQTGDVELAANVAIHVYGEQGKKLNEQIRKQIETLLAPSGITIDAAVFRADGTFDPKKLREFAEAQKEALGGIESKTYQELIKLSDNAEKDFAKTIEGWLKAVEKAKGFTDKMLDLARRTRTEIDAITTQKGYAETRVAELLGLGDLNAEQSEELKQLQGFLAIADNLIQGFKDKQAKEHGALTYEAFKDSPMYVQMFDDLDHASTRMLENMKSRMEGLKEEWTNLTPTQLKEMQSRMDEIDSQLAKRNPFKTLTAAIRKYRDYMKNGETDGGTKSAKEADTKLADAAKVADDARKKYDELVKKYGEGSEKSVQEVIDAKKELDEAMANEAAAEKAVENWKKVKDAIGLSANELFQMLNWAGDIAKGIADISEAMGADEEDVQYWNDVADALNQISGGIQDIVSAAMSGNVVGIISSTLTAIPKMFVGFTNLFSAGKIKKANKEIKRQQELLDQLEYTYGRLEKAADKLFGAAYLNNYNQQLENLQAQQAAYLKQAEAERGKGKKADKERIEEYEKQVRETANAIKDMQADLAAHFTGSNRTDAARRMAQSWIDARASMSDTFAAIRGDYSEMIKNMIVEGAAARVIENALTPVWDNMEKMLADNDVDGAIDALVKGMDAALTQANDGMEVLWQALEQRGYDMKALLSDAESEYSGIAKRVSGATSEEINANTAALNTQNYYVSHLPTISQNVAEILAVLTRGGRVPSVSDGAGWSDWQRQAMDNYNAIARNTADTVVECRRAAAACEAATEKLSRAFRSKGATGGFNVFLE